MNPVAPVTRALRTGMAGDILTIAIDLPGGQLLRPSGLLAETAIPIGGQLHGLVEGQRRTPAESHSRLGAVQMQEARFGKAAGRVIDLRTRPCGAQSLDQQPHRFSVVVGWPEIPVVGSTDI